MPFVALRAFASAALIISSSAPAQEVDIELTYNIAKVNILIYGLLMYLIYRVIIIILYVIYFYPEIHKGKIPISASNT